MAALAWLAVTALPAQVMGPNPNYYFHTFNNLYQLNPAMAGSNGELTSFLTYHQQVISGFDDAPRHLSLTADAPLGKKQLSSFGANLYTFRRSILQTSGMSGTFSRKFLIGGKKTHSLRLGVSAGFLHNSVNPDGVNLADPAVARLNGKIRPDLSVGANYQLKHFQFGVAFPKFISTSVRADGDRSVSAMKVNPLGNQLFYFLYDFEINKKWAIRPMVIYRSFTDAFSGLELNARVLYNEKVWAGLAYRQSLGAAAYVGFKSKKLSFGYAYKMSNSNPYGYSNPAHELQLGAYWGKLKKKKNLYVHKARFNKAEDAVAGKATKTKAKPMAKMPPPSKIPETKPAPVGDESYRLTVETVRRGDLPDDMISGNYLVVSAFSTVQEAQKEVARLKSVSQPDPKHNAARIGYNSTKNLYYVYLLNGNMDEVMGQCNELRTKKGFEKAGVLKITNRPHGSGN